MKLKVDWACSVSELELGKGSTGRDVLKALKLNPESVLLVKNGVLVTEDEPLGEGDEVKLLNVASGG
ncbi:MAG TPA: MoaD/ThiS family protein [archaeon]|nr:MoaD/ThiS family protein [archaeon]